MHCMLLTTGLNNGCELGVVLCIEALEVDTVYLSTEEISNTIVWQGCLCLKVSDDIMSIALVILLKQF